MSPRVRAGAPVAYKDSANNGLSTSSGFLVYHRVGNTQPVPAKVRLTRLTRRIVLGSELDARLALSLFERQQLRWEDNTSVDPGRQGIPNWSATCQDRAA